MRVTYYYSNDKEYINTASHNDLLQLFSPPDSNIAFHGCHNISHDMNSECLWPRGCEIDGSREATVGGFKPHTTFKLPCGPFQRKLWALESQKTSLNLFAQMQRKLWPFLEYGPGFHSSCPC